MRIVFMGTPLAAVPSLERMIAAGHEIVAVYSQPDRPSGRGNRITFSPVKQFAVDHGLLVMQPAKVRTDEAAHTFRSHAADVAVVVAYGRILPDSFLSAFHYGAVNVHFSLLPKYRGAAPVNWAIVNGETETGVTTMKMDSGLDTGDILMQRSTPIGSNENAVELMEGLSMIGADLLEETLVQIDRIEPQVQDHAKSTLAPLMSKEDGRVDWKMTACEIANRIRGFQPFPTAFTSFRGARLTLWQGSEAAADELETNNVPGSIVSAAGDVLVVQCGGRTLLQVTEAQPEGKRRMSVRDLINGIRPVNGEILGQ
ncbi:MAG: methionyl-tRNA formyltransferase [Acidobacteriota bacterium]